MQRGKRGREEQKKNERSLSPCTPQRQSGRLPHRSAARWKGADCSQELEAVSKEAGVGSAHPFSFVALPPCVLFAPLAPYLL